MGALEQNTTLIYGVHVRESANDGSDFGNAAADYRIWFVGEDGLMHLKDSAGTVTTPGVAAGAITSSGLTMATARLLGRTTASTGAVEEITVGSGLSLAAGSLTATGGGSQGQEIDYAQITSPVSVTATAEASADTVVSGAAVAYSAVPYLFEFYCPNADPQNTALASLTFYLYDGSSSIGIIGNRRQQTSAESFEPICCKRRLTPSAATHTYSIRATTSSGTGTVTAGAGGSGNYVPAYLRITLV